MDLLQYSEIIGAAAGAILGGFFSFFMQRISIKNELIKEKKSNAEKELEKDKNLEFFMKETQLWKDEINGNFKEIKRNNSDNFKEHNEFALNDIELKSELKYLSNDITEIKSDLKEIKTTINDMLQRMGSFADLKEIILNKLNY